MSEENACDLSGTVPAISVIFSWLRADMSMIQVMMICILFLFINFHFICVHN